jgi:hypothetical protein
MFQGIQMPSWAILFGIPRTPRIKPIQSDLRKPMTLGSIGVVYGSGPRIGMDLIRVARRRILRVFDRARTALSVGAPGTPSPGIAVLLCATSTPLGMLTTMSGSVSRGPVKLDPFYSLSLGGIFPVFPFFVPIPVLELRARRRFPSENRSAHKF